MISFGFVKRSALLAILSGQPRQAVVAKEKTRTRDVQVFAFTEGLSLYTPDGHPAKLLDTSDPTSSVLLEVLAERERVKDQKGYDSEVDDGYKQDELVRAGLAYSLASVVPHQSSQAVKWWPWQSQTFRPRNRRRNLIKAIGLLVAEVERIDRLQ